MKLEQSQKDDLKSLTEHRGFKILEALMKEMEYDLLKQFKKANLADADIWAKLNWVQNKLAWAEYLINTAKWNTQQIVKKDIK